MSGTAFNPWVFPTFPNYAQALAKQMGFNGTSDAQILKFLENCSPFDFIIAKNLIVKQQREFGRFEDIVVGPVVEPYWSKNAFISKNTTAAARIAWSNKIDVIISGNSFEGLFQAYKEYTENIELYISFFNKNSALFVPIGELKLDPSSQQAKTYGHEVRDLYFDSSENVTVKNLNSLYKVRFKELKN